MGRQTRERGAGRERSTGVLLDNNRDELPGLCLSFFAAGVRQVLHREADN